LERRTILVLPRPGPDTNDPAHAGQGGGGAAVVVVVAGAVVVVGTVVVVGAAVVVVVGGTVVGVGGTVDGMVVTVGPPVGGGVGDDVGDSAELGRALVPAIVSVLSGRTMGANSGSAVAMILERGAVVPDGRLDVAIFGGTVVDVLVGVGSGGVTIGATATS